jgi:hypothetical protein
VTFHVGDHFFLRATCGQFVPEVFHEPILVRGLAGEAGPEVGYSHGEAEIEACAALGWRAGEAGHATDILGDGEGMGIDFVDEVVGEGEVGEGVIVDAWVEVICCAGEVAAESMIEVEHGGDAIEAEAIELEFLDPVAAVREQEMEDGGLAVIEAAAVPCGVETARTVMEVEVRCAIEDREAFRFIADRVGMN